MALVHPAGRTVVHPALAVAALLVALVAPAGAATYTWDNAAGGAWSTAANWSPAGVPGAGDAAVLPAGVYTVTLDAAPTLASLSLAGGATLDLGTHTLAGVAAVANAGTLRNFRGAFTDEQVHNLAAGVVEVAANDSIVLADSLVNDGRIVVGYGSRVHVAAPSVLSGSGSLVLASGARVTCPIDRPAYPYWITNDWNHVITGAGDVWVPVANRGRVVEDGTYGQQFTLHCVVYNWGSLEAGGGAHLRLDTPLLKQFGGRVVGHDGRVTVVATNGSGGTIDNLNGGAFVADGGDLWITGGTVAGGHFQRAGSTGLVRVDAYMDPQNMVVDAGAEVAIEQLMDLQCDQSALENHGIVRVRGTLNINGPSNIRIAFAGDGQVVLEGGTLATPGGALLTNGASHTITGCGTLSANVDNYGTISVDCPEMRQESFKGRITNRNLITVKGGTLLLNASTLVNRGTFSGGDGIVKMQNGARVENQAAGRVLAGRGSFFLGLRTPASTITGGALATVNGGAFRTAGAAELTGVTLEPGATLSTMANATTRVKGATFANRGVVEVLAGGTFVADATTAYDDAGGATRLAGGTLDLPAGFRVRGTLAGTGTVRGAVVNEGAIEPDVAAAPLAITGDYAQAASGRLGLGIAGAEAGQFARLTVSGAAALDGTVDIAAANGFVPAEGQDFAVMAFASRTGQFAQVEADAGLTLDPEYGSGGVTLRSARIVGVPAVPAPPAVLAFAARGMAFQLDLPAAADVTVRAYDVRGRELGVLVHDRLAAGVHPVTLDGRALPSGMVFARATVRTATASEQRTARVAFVR